MEEDRLRTDRVRQEITTAGLDALLCQGSSHVLMLTGYAPVLGQSFVLFPAKGEPVLLVPTAEEPFARQGWCTDVRTYESAALARHVSVLDAVRPILEAIISDRGLDAASFGCEETSAMVPASYSQVGFPSAGMIATLRQAFPRAQFIDAAPILRLLQATLTPREVERLAKAVDVAMLGFEAARGHVQAGSNESTIAAAAEAAIQSSGRKKGVGRVLAFAHVMSGARAALAYEPFNLTSDRVIRPGDPVLVQLEVYADGFWSEATRTYFAGEPGAEGRRIYEACREAQRQALQAIHAGVAASDVDKVARDYLARGGFEQNFRHGLGHGVGFQAISHLQPPELYPGSTDTILEDMVFNVEPGVYVHGWGGIRINDTVRCRTRDAVVLTEMIPRDLDYAIVSRRARAVA